MSFGALLEHELGNNSRGEPGATCGCRGDTSAGAASCFQVAERRVLQCALRGEYYVWPLFSGGAHGLDHLRGGVSYLLEELAKVSTRVSFSIPSKLTEYGSPAVGRDSLQVLDGAVVMI